MTVLGLVVGFGAGLFVGWNFLPQPAWVKDAWQKVWKSVR